MSLADFSQQLANLVDGAAPGVVALRTPRGATASGILYRDSLVLTADHALHGHDAPTVTLPDGRSAAATVAGRDPGTDVAVLRLAEPIAAPVWQPAGQPRTGALALAVGRGSTNGAHAALGILSLVGEAWRTMRGGQIATLLRLDIGLHPGQSGGAVIDAQGRWIGMATRGLTRLGAVAIPPETLARVAGAVLQRGRVVRGYLGLGLQPVPLPAHLTKQLHRTQPHGMIVVSLEQDGPAERSGLTLGDVLTAVNGQPLEDTGDLLAYLDLGSPGRQLTCELFRGGRVETLAVTVGEKED